MCSIAQVCYNVLYQGSLVGFTRQEFAGVPIMYTYLPIHIQYRTKLTNDVFLYSHAYAARLHAQLLSALPVRRIDQPPAKMCKFCYCLFMIRCDFPLPACRVYVCPAYVMCFTHPQTCLTDQVHYRERRTVLIG